MTKIFKTLSLALVFVLCFSAIPVSAQETNTSELTVQSGVEMELVSDQNAQYTGIVPFGPAIPVSNVQYVGGRIGSNGNVYITMLISGQGSYYATWDGIQVKNYQYVGTIGTNPVTGFYAEFDCGKAYVGNHTFYLKATSFNHPYGWASRTVNITIS